MKYLPLLFLFACTSSVQTVIPESQTVAGVRVDTVYIKDLGEYGTAYGGVCDTAAILALLCKGEVSGESEGLKWRVLYQTEVQKVDSLSRARTRTVVRVVRDSIRVPIPPELISERDRLRSELSQAKIDLAESSTTIWKQYVAIGILTFALLLCGYFVIKRFIP